MTSDDPDLPVSVRLGTVVPPEDPEDWTRPLTWVAAAGMLLAPAVALGWFSLSPPARIEVTPMTGVLAGALAAGGVATGWTQMGRPRAVAGILGGALFGALATVAVGLLLAGERQVGSASPTLAHAAYAAIAGIGGALAAATAAWWLVPRSTPTIRLVAPLLVGTAGAALATVAMA